MQKIHSTIYSSQSALLLSAHPPCALFSFFEIFTVLSDKNNLQLLSALHFLLKVLCLTQDCFTPLLWYCTATAIAILCYYIYVLFHPFLWKFLTCSKILNVLLWRYNWGFAIYCMCYSPLSAMLLLLPLPLPSFRFTALQCNPIVQCTTTAHTASSLPLLWCVICSVLSCPASSRGMYLLLLSSIVKRGGDGERATRISERGELLQILNFMNVANFTFVQICATLLTTYYCWVIHLGSALKC